MSKYDQEYYIPFAPNNNDKIFLGKMDQNTVFRHQHFHRLNMADGPMMYWSDYREEDKADGTKTPLPDVYTTLGFMLIPKPFMEFLRYFDLPGLQLFPAVYVDDDDVWHEHLWLVNFYEGLDCIDLDNSIVKNKSIEPGYDYRVKKPSLSDEVLSKIPEDQRLMFKVSGVKPKHLYCHQRIVDFVHEIGYTGIEFIKVADFKEGMQRAPG